MKSSTDIDNRGPEMNEYLEARVDALKRRVAELEKGNSIIPLADAMVCLSCGSIMRVGQTCCGDTSLLSAWLTGIEDKTKSAAH